MVAVHPEAWQLALLALAWMLYLSLHSLLASLRCKAFVATRWPLCFAWYRLIFNLIAVTTLLPPLWIMQHLHGPLLWEWRGVWAGLADGLAALAVIGMLWTARYYDMKAFVGLQRATSSGARFALSPLHYVVRHPWYFLALIILWTRDMDVAHLLTALAANLYLVVGARLEENKLVSELGAAYREYMRLVPSLIPRPWRMLRRADAQRLMTFNGP